MSVIIAGYLEIDQERGVIYFHSSSTGHTPLRICSLPQPVPNPSEYGVSLDITHMQGCSWGVIGIDLSKVEARLINNIRSPV